MCNLVLNCSLYLISVVNKRFLNAAHFEQSLFFGFLNEFSPRVVASPGVVPYLDEPPRLVQPQDLLHLRASVALVIDPDPVRPQEREQLEPLDQPRDARDRRVVVGRTNGEAPLFVACSEFHHL